MSSESGAPKLKRQRTEEAIPERQQQILKHSEYWFDDGNVILQVENTLFRVHRSMLAHHSAVFKDMFGIPQPENPNEPQVEGCQVVPLYDSLQDVEIIISILYGKPKFFPLFKAVSIEQVAAMLRLGTKYEIGHFRTQALEILHYEHPTTLKDFDKSCQSDNGRLTYVPTTSTQILNLALEFSLETVFPSAYFIKLEESLESLIVNDSNPPLDKRAQVNCLLGRNKLIFWLNETLHNSLELVAEARYNPDCQNVSKCVPERKRLVRGFHFWMKGYDDMVGLLSPCWEEPKKHSLCRTCSKSLQVAHAAIREGIWAKLPSFFGLPDWPASESDD